jgi:menaquinone-dependent protoporphyrinogen IX oxidase
MSKILISYQTMYGSTKEAALLIADILEKHFGFQVDLHQFEENKTNPDSSNYDSIVIGSCIFHGKWGRTAERFLSNDFSNKNVAIFVCAGFAGEERFYKQAHKFFVNDVLRKYSHIKPVSTKAFGGRVPRSKIPYIWFQQTLKKMQKFGYDTRNLEKVKEWSHELGVLFQKT